MEDSDDEFPLDVTEWEDVNGDGLGDNKNQLSTFDEFKQSPTVPIVMIFLVLAIMFLLYRQQPGSRFRTLPQNSISSNDANTTQRNETNEVEAHTLGKNECRMDKDHKVTCPECKSKLGVPDDSVPPFKFTCPKCETKIKVVPTEKF